MHSKVAQDSTRYVPFLLQVTGLCAEGKCSNLVNFVMGVIEDETYKERRVRGRGWQVLLFSSLCSKSLLVSLHCSSFIDKN